MNYKACELSVVLIILSCTPQ